MKPRNSILCVTTLILGVTLFSGHAWAGSIEIPISGTHTSTSIDPGVQFTDDDGILHYRGLVQDVVIAGQDLDGALVTGEGQYLININIDLATGNGDMNVQSSLEMTYGDLVGAFRGRADLTITGFVWDGPFNYIHGNGDFEGWHWRGDVTGIFPLPEAQWEGVFQIPGGGGGDKAAASEAKTWGEVKALFR